MGQGFHCDYCIHNLEFNVDHMSHDVAPYFGHFQAARYNSGHSKSVYKYLMITWTCWVALAIAAAVLRKRVKCEIQW